MPATAIRQSANRLVRRFGKPVLLRRVSTLGQVNSEQPWKGSVHDETSTRVRAAFVPFDTKERAGIRYESGEAITAQDVKVLFGQLPSGKIVPDDRIVDDSGTDAITYTAKQVKPYEVNGNPVAWEVWARR